MSSTHLSIKLALLFSIIGLSACETVEQQDWQTFCANDKWAEHGYFDATEGFSIKLAREYKERCGAQFSDKEMSLYQRGYIQGIQKFCTQEKGYELGKKNEPNPETCPAELQDAFVAGYKRGKVEYLQFQNILTDRKNRSDEMSNLRDPASMRDPDR